MSFKNKNITIYFSPTENITAFELAHIVKNLGGIGAPKDGISISYRDWRDMNAEIKRHFWCDPEEEAKFQK